MTILFLILIVIASAALAFLVLVQNPKGGGLASNVGGLSNQLMGVKQTTDVLEKGTWLFAGIIASLALFSILFLKGGNMPDNPIRNVPTTAQPTSPAPQQAAPANTTTINPDSVKK